MTEVTRELVLSFSIKEVSQAAFYAKLTLSYIT